LKVAAVTPADVERFRDAVSEGATAARIKTWQTRARAGHGRSRNCSPRDGYARRAVFLRSA
jgi:hypothetical protein